MVIQFVARLQCTWFRVHLNVFNFVAAIALWCAFDFEIRFTFRVYLPDFVTARCRKAHHQWQELWEHYIFRVIWRAWWVMKYARIATFQCKNTLHYIWYTWIKYNFGFKQRKALSVDAGLGAFYIYIQLFYVMNVTLYLLYIVFLSI